jgi:hypothetical protein
MSFAFSFFTNAQELDHFAGIDARLRQQLALNASSSMSNLQLQASLGALQANQFNGSGFSQASLMMRDPRFNSLETQIQHHQQRLRELGALQSQERGALTSASLQSGSTALASLFPQLSSMGELSSPHLSRQQDSATASLSGYRAALMAGLVNEQEFQNLINAANGSSRSFSRSLVPERQPRLQQMPTGSAVSTAATNTTTASKAKKNSYLEVEANYDPGKVKDLSLPSDSANLSEYQCLLRKQIILFSVAAQDIQCSAQGRNKPISLGQVGVLCRHCSCVPPGMRPCGAVYFPAQLSGLYQASQNMAINHFSKSCQRIPEPLREKLMKLKERKSTVLGGGKHFWANGARVIGVVEDDGKLVFAEEIEAS